MSSEESRRGEGIEIGDGVFVVNEEVYEGEDTVGTGGEKRVGREVVDGAVNGGEKEGSEPGGAGLHESGEEGVCGFGFEVVLE